LLHHPLIRFATSASGCSTIKIIDKLDIELAGTCNKKLGGMIGLVLEIG
jgi:hypothetical protein